MNAFWVVLVAVAITLGAVSDSRAQSARPPAADDALKRGFEMAKRERWSLAIRYFGKAQELAPTDAIVLFNLALANDRAEGRDIIATAWYQAYLAIAPDAANAAKVRSRITDLEIKVEASVIDMLETVKAVSVQLKGRSKVAATAELVGAQAVIGNVQEAVFGLDALPPGSQSDWARARVAAAQAKSGAMSAAKATAGEIKRLPVRRWAQAEIAVREALRSEFGAAVQTAEGIGAGAEQDFTFSRIAALQARAGDLPGAQTSAERISKTAMAQRIAANAAIATASFKSGQPWLVEKAAAILADGFAQAGTIQDAAQRQMVLLQIVRARAEIGDGPGAEQAAALMNDARFKHLAAKAIAEARGDAKAAAVHRWSALAYQAMASTTMQGFPTVLKNANEGKADEAIRIIASAIEERAQFAEKLR